jgi:hypothetical protein
VEKPTKALSFDLEDCGYLDRKRLLNDVPQFQFILLITIVNLSNLSQPDTTQR